MSINRSQRIALGVVVIIGVVAWGVLVWLRSPRLTPELRGYELAERLGCHGCHGPGGLGGIPNPLGEDREIPAWDGGTAMMYVESDEDIRGWILDGYPERLASKYETTLRERNDDPHALPVMMPAYRDLVSDAEVDDLVAYFKAVSNYRDMPDEARHGYRVAMRAGCFGCHGPAGLVGAANPRSFKGYIPPWRGADFRDLVHNDDELRAWIRDGHIDRLESFPLAGWFLGRQIVQMPAYGDVLDGEDVDAIVAYIHWLDG